MIAVSVYFLLTLLGLLVPRSKFVASLQWLVLTVYIAFNTGGMDMNNYKSMFLYNGRNFHFDPLSKEFLYSWLEFEFYQRNFDFVGFNSIIICAFSPILLYFVLKNSKLPSLVMSFIMVYPGIELVIQKRNTLALFILLFGINALLNFKKNNKLIYIICTVIASYIHSSFIVYILVLLIPKIEIDRFRILIWRIFPLIIIATPLIPNIARLFMSEGVFYTYFVDEAMSLNFSKALFFMLMQLSIFFVFLKLFEFIEDDVNRQWAFKFLCFSFLFITTYFFGSNFVRIYRNLLILFYCSSLISVQNMERILQGRLNIYYFILIVLLLINFSVSYLFGLGWDMVAKPIFIENLLIELFLH
ncbi:EpsG family protein [Streptococcus sp. P25B114]